MTPKEKVQDLVDRFREFADGTDPETDRYSPNIEKQKAKQCALISVDEIIKSREDDGVFNDLKSAEGSEYYTPHPMYLTFWNNVKQEIELL